MGREPVCHQDQRGSTIKTADGTETTEMLSLGGGMESQDGTGLIIASLCITYRINTHARRIQPDQQHFSPGLSGFMKGLDVPSGGPIKPFSS